MYADARKLASGAELTADICIIGAGAAGITVARELMSSGHRVLLVETGGLRLNSKLDALSEDGVAREGHSDLGSYRRRSVGGSTSIWGGRCVPYDPIDFEPRSWAPSSGWPIEAEDLARYYARAAHYCEIGDPDFDAYTAISPHSPFVEGFQSSRTPDSSIERCSPPTNFGKAWGKGLAKSESVQVIGHATCVKLVPCAQDSGRIERARFKREDGGTLTVHAKVFVVAAGALETYRLLAVSDDQRPGGLGNSGDALGRYFMSHIEGLMATLRLRAPEQKIVWGFSRTRDGVYAVRRFGVSAEVQRELESLNFIMRLSHANAADPGHGQAILSLMFFAKNFILPEYRRKMTTGQRAGQSQFSKGARFWGAHIGNIIRGIVPLSAFLVDWVVRRHLIYRRLPYVLLRSANGAYPLEFYAEQAPNRDSRISLSSEVDRFGVPKAVLDWRMTELDVQSIAVNLRALRDELALSGCAVLEFGDDQDLEARIAREALPVGGHIIGVARMSADDRTGVVDANLRIHGVRNAYVVGSAVLPTSSQANPTFTIVALAVRLADHLKKMTVA